MPAGTINKDGVPPRIIVADANIPNSIIKPTGFTETAPGIMTHPIGTVEPSIKSPVERMGAAQPWRSKAGYAIAAADAHDPPSSKPSMRFKPAPKGGPTGPTATPAGQADAGGYSGASAGGGYT